MGVDKRIPTASLRPIEKRAWGEDAARHLLWRAGFGGPPAQVKYLARLMPEDAVSALLDFDKVAGYEPVRPDDFDDSIMKPPTERQRRESQRARRARRPT